MNNAIASVAHKIPRRLRTPNMRRLRAPRSGNRIHAARMEGMAARDAPDPQPQTVGHAVNFHGLERVLRAAWIETATRSQQRAESPLVHAYQALEDHCAH